MRRYLPILSLLLLLPATAYAQPVVAGVDQLLTQFQTVSAGWGGRIQALAMGTFGLLAIIDLVWCVGYRTLMSRGEMPDFIYALVHEVIFLSFFFWLLTTFSTTGPLIIKSFQFAAQQAGGIPSQPNAVFAEGIKIASDICAQVSIWHPGDSLSLILCGLIVVTCFALITASMVVIIVESFFIVSAGQILLMFGGSHFTVDMVHALIRQVIGIGLKLYILQLIASVGAAFIAGWTTATGAGTVTFQGIMIEIGLSLLLLAVTMMVPSRFERLVTHIGSGGVGDLAAAGGAVAMASSVVARGVMKGMAAAGGAIAATGSAARLAQTQQAIRQANGGGASTPEGRVAALIGSTAANLVSAKATDIGRGLRGTRSNLGEPSWRMSSDLNERNRLLREENNTL